MKITVIGRPTQTVERGEVVILGLINETAPSLPKGLPAPPTPTKYVVLVARKQWQKVADALIHPDDRVIIEGYPTYAPPWLRPCYDERALQSNAATAYCGNR